MGYSGLKNFRFKMINNRLAYGQWLGKINKDINPNCDFCRKTENMQHMIFDCMSIKKIWNEISDIIKRKLNWSNILLGYYNEPNINTITINNIITQVALTIYKYNNKAKRKKITMNIKTLRKYINTDMEILMMYSKTTQKYNTRMMKTILIQTEENL